MTLRELYFSFNGRIGRQSYWLSGALVFALILIFAAFLDLAFNANEALFGVCELLLVWPSLAIQAKRWHDRDKSAWWILFSFIPIIGPIWSLIELGFLKGTEGANQYGPEPTTALTSSALKGLAH